ncbi:MAG: hypothetical protein JNM18_24770 [Planctomycetaceae bacterium]|nr:hypothetical protein [Planctomycetaceae bacterium]
MNDDSNLVNRDLVAQMLRDSFEEGLKFRIERYLAAKQLMVIPSSHFSRAFRECAELYTSGNFIATTMVAQAVAEGVANYIAKRIGVERHSEMNLDCLAGVLVVEEAILLSTAKAIRAIRKKYRNDYHHMNPKVKDLDHERWAGECISDLASIASDVFGSQIVNGELVLNYPKYWDVNSDGDVKANVRFKA